MQSEKNECPNKWKALPTTCDEEVEFSDTVNIGQGKPLFKTPVSMGIASRDKFKPPSQNPLDSEKVTNTALSCQVQRKTEAASDRTASNIAETAQDACKAVVSNSTFPYKAPSWSGIPDKQYRYSFEVLKGGVIVSTVDLSERAFTVFGRMTDCHVVMEHPSLSRYHAVVQYRTTGIDENQKGFYIYDLGSTHGTFLNKQQLRARTYTRLHVGHVLKFGGSSRLHILQGPGQDEGEGSSLTVTELKYLRKRQQELQVEHQKPSGNLQGLMETADDDEGITWGLGEDAVEETDMENPFALSTCNEDLYLNDPKKTLRGWFEREGYDLEYDVQEKGFGHFICKINLPIDTPSGEPIIAETSVQGKKKEAVAACALEACRILDRSGLLRQSHHEGRKRKEKNWEEADYYDSDEDTYLDRTGTIEKKREMRMKIIKKDHPVETYDSLVKKLDEVRQKTSEISNALEKQKQSFQTSYEIGQDSLDSYMSSLKSGAEVDKKTTSKLRLQLSQLRQEESKLCKLVDIARPSSLPDIAKQQLDEVNIRHTISQFSASKTRATTKFSASEGKKMQEGNTSSVVATCSDKDVKQDVDCNSRLSTKNNSDACQAVNEPTDQCEEPQDNRERKPKAEETTVKDKPKLIGPARPPLSISQEQQAPTKNSLNSRQKRKDISGKATNVQNEYDAPKEGYELWLPPEGQSGDGRTSLNDKYGY